MPKRGPLRGPPAKRRKGDAAAITGSRGITAGSKVPFSLKWDEDVESSDDSEEDMTHKKSRKPDQEDEDFEDDELDPEQHRKQ